MSVRVWFFLVVVFVVEVSINSQVDARKRINEEGKSGKWHEFIYPLNHFDVLEKRAFKGRYITNDQFFKKGGPIVVYVGGEWEIKDWGVMGGVAFQLAKRHKGYLLYTEHRFFGETKPFEGEPTNERLRHHGIHQALADLSYLLDHLKTTVDGLQHSEVILAGGSYAGTMAVWAREKYPHIVSASYTCGPVIKAMVENTEYSQVVHNVYKRSGPECFNTVIQGTKEVVELLKRNDGKEKLKELFPYWACLAYIDQWDTHRLAIRIMQLFNTQLTPFDQVLKTCDLLSTVTAGTPLERISQVGDQLVYFNNTEACNITDNKSWYWITCTGLGNIQVTNSSNYGDSLQTIDYQIEDSCLRLFGPDFDYNFVAKGVNHHKIMYGSDTPDVTKVLFVQGTHDPWLYGSVLDDLNDKSLVIYIDAAAHCLELGETQDDDLPQVVQSKILIEKIMAEWIR